MQNSEPGLVIKLQTKAGIDKFGANASKHKLGARTGRYNLVARVGKYKLGARAGKYKYRPKDRKYKLGARTRTGGKAKDWDWELQTPSVKRIQKMCLPSENEKTVQK